MKVYGHPWSVNTRKALMTLAEKGGQAEFVLILIPKGEQKSAEHVARHPFGKVPVLDDDGFVLYETAAIERYLDRKLGGTPLVPAKAAAAARMDQWLSNASSYFEPHAHAFLVETLFRRYLGGEQDRALVAASRAAMEPALDVAEQWLGQNAYFAGSDFSLADVHFMPCVEYLIQTGAGEPITRRKQLHGWWERVSARPAWQRVARSGPQPYEREMSSEVLEKRYRSA